MLLYIPATETAAVFVAANAGYFGSGSCFPIRPWPDAFPAQQEEMHWLARA